MATWKSRGLRGSSFEEFINHSIEIYRRQKLALIQKVPTPITPIEIDKKSRHITLAYFDKKSTVDYLGVVQGIPVCFDAKECNRDTFSLSNIHEHQIEFMREFEEQGGISFIMISFTKKDEMYLIPFTKLSEYWENMKNGGRKSVRYEELSLNYKINRHRDILVHFLDALNRYLEGRERNEDIS